MPPCLRTQDKTLLENTICYNLLMKIILASSSIGRKRVLKNLGLKFEIIPANIDEEKFTASNPITLVKKIAKAKALAVLGVRGGHQFLRNERSEATPAAAGFVPQKIAWPTSARRDRQPYLIIAADSLVLFAGKTYGKPKTKTQAKEILTMLSGKTHEFLTGLYIINTKTNKRYQISCKTRVIFKKFSDQEINTYIKASPVTTHAGAYSTSDDFIKNKCKLIGSATNVVGLPVEILLPILKENGIKVKSQGGN